VKLCSSTIFHSNETRGIFHQRCSLPLPFFFAELNQHQKSLLAQISANFRVCSTLYLKKLQLTCEDMEIVVKHAIITKRCTSLLLVENKIGSVGASILASALHKNKTLKTLALSDNPVSDKGVRCLAEKLSTNNHSLRALYLGQTDMTDLGVKYLTKMLKTNETLTLLGLSNNAISDKGVQLLSKVLKSPNTTLQWVILSENNSITDSSVEYLCDIIEHHPALLSLWVSKCQLSDMGKTRLRKAAQSNTHLDLRV
jgi:Ran GTPase-activating protein (RanGAP) involved in mRNA processing and transport